MKHGSKMILAAMMTGSVLLAGCGGGGGGTTPVADAVPAGARMAAVGTGGELRIFNVNASGAVAFLQSFNVGGSVVSMSHDPASRTFYFGMDNTDSIEFVRFNAQGAVIGQGSAATPNSDVILKRHPSKPVLYALDPLADKVHFYSIGVNGGLTAMNPASIDVADEPRDIVFSPNGENVYMVFKGTQNMAAGTVLASGHIEPLVNGSFGTGSAVRNLVMVADGTKLYAMGEGSSIYQWTIGGGGLPAWVNPPSVNFGMPNFRAGVSSRGLVMAYKENDEGIVVYRPGANGALAKTSDYMTSGQTNIFGSPWVDTVVLARVGSSAGEVVVGTEAGTLTKVQDVTLPVGTVDVVFYAE